MAKVDGSISSLIQGVSQQPARERLPGQGELQINCSSDPVNGLTRRPPTEWIKQLISSADDYTFTNYDAGSLGTFIIAHKEGEIKVFDLSGTEYTVVVDGTSDDYIPASEMRYIGIDDKIYLVDPTKTVEMLPDTRSYVENGALVFLLGGQYARTYRIDIDWDGGSVFGEFQTPDGSAASHIEFIPTTKLIQFIMGDISPSGSYPWTEDPIGAKTDFTDNFDYTIKDDVVYIEPKAGSGITEFNITVADGDGGTNFFAVNNSVGDVGDLPLYAPNGFLVKVEESSASEDDWYLEFIVSDDSITTVGDGFGKEGYWVETTAPDLEYKFDPDTMPHVLEKTDTTEFTLTQPEWGERAVGDDDTNPLPSFVGNTIADMGSFQGRLGFVSDVNLILSRTNKPNEFFNQSATTLVDDDPIDISSALGTFVLRDIVPHNRDLVIFSDRAQFILFGRNAITPKNSSLVLTTEFEADLTAKPVGAGRNIFFSFKYGQYSGIQEFFTDGGEDVNDSRSITQHVLQYIRGVSTELVSTTNFNKLIVQSDFDKKVVYIYEYIWVDRKKVQTSWSKWVFDYDIERMFFVDNLLYIIQRNGSSYDMYTLDLDDTEDTGLTYRVMLDQKIKKDSVNTTFTVPYSIDDIDDYVAVQGSGCPNPGMRVLIESESSGTVTLKTDMEGGSVYFGKKYLSRYIPTSPFVRDQNNVKIGSGSLVIKYFVIHFDKTGYFKSIITDDYGYTASVEYNGRILGAPTNIIGQPAVTDGSFKVPYKKNTENSNLEIQSDSHLPMYLTEMEWVGSWRKKGKRITGG